MLREMRYRVKRESALKKKQDKFLQQILNTKILESLHEIHLHLLRPSHGSFQNATDRSEVNSLAPVKEGVEIQYSELEGLRYNILNLTAHQLRRYKLSLCIMIILL